MLFFKKSLLTLLWCLLIGSVLPAQYHLTKTYTVADGLPMTEIAKCMVSREGRLFFMTTSGHRLSFDGFTFTHFSQNQTIQKTNTIERILEDRHGVWMLIGGSVYRYRNNEETKMEMPLNNIGWLDERQDRLVLADTSGALYTFNPDRQQLEIDAELTARRAAYGDIRAYYRRSRFGKTWDLVYHHDKRGAFVYELADEAGEKDRLIYPEEIRSFFPITPRKAAVDLLNRTEGFEVTPHLFEDGKMKPIDGIDWGGRKRDFSNYHFSESRGRMFLCGRPPAGIAQSDEDLEIWELDTLGRARLFVRCRLWTAIRNLEPQLDAAGNFWLQSHSGLVNIFPAFLSCFEGHPNMNGGLHTISEDARGRIWLGSYRHGFVVFDGDWVQKPPPEAAAFSRIMPGSFRDDQGFMHFFNEPAYGFFKTNGREWRFKEIEVRTPADRFTGFCFLPLSNQQLAMGLFNHLGIGLMDPPCEPGNPVTFIDSTKGMLLQNVLTIAEDRKQRIWFGRLRSATGYGGDLADPFSKRDRRFEFSRRFKRNALAGHKPGISLPYRTS